MLRSIYISNVVLIDKLDLDFGSGLSVLTGETGAGKSILLDSLGLVLGNRAETGLIWSGADKLSVTAMFDGQEANTPLQNLLSSGSLRSTICCRMQHSTYIPSDDNARPHVQMNAVHCSRLLRTCYWI